MAENIIVGAGLAGLVAAINLARRGREVLVLEKESGVGGSPLYHPSPQGTPLPVEGFRAYSGIDLKEAKEAVAPFQTGRAVVYGEAIPIDMGAISAYMIERGPRSTSLDSFLYGLAVREGVRFEFNHPLMSGDDVAELPPDSIIATGLHFEGFDACRVPYLTSFHYVARKAHPDTSSNHVTIYHGRFTSDYAYSCSTNGVLFAHVFQRRPIGRGTLEAFEEQLFLSEGIEFPRWDHFTFPVPAASMNNPRLFAGDKILAGTLSGCMESYMFFGMLGALVSGKIAADAVTDREAAYRQFRLATASFRGAYTLKKLTGLQPHSLQKLALRLALGKLYGRYLFVSRIIRESMPGWGNCARAPVE